MPVARTVGSLIFWLFASLAIAGLAYWVHQSAAVFWVAFVVALTLVWVVRQVDRRRS